MSKTLLDDATTYTDGYLHTTQGFLFQCFLFRKKKKRKKEKKELN